MIQSYERQARIQTDHPDLWKLYLNDADVHAWLQMYFIEQCTMEEALIGLTLAMAKKKQYYFDECLKLTQNAAAPKTYLIQKDKREKFNDGDDVKLTELPS